MQKIQNYTGSTSSWPTAPSSWQWQPIQPNQLPPGCFAPRKSIPACSFAGFEPNVLWRAMKKVQNVDMNPLATSWTVPPDAHEGYEKRMKCLAANPGKSTACRLFCSKEKAALLAPLQVLNPKCHPVLWHPVLLAAGSQKACHLTPMKPIKNGCSACAAAEIA